MMDRVLITGGSGFVGACLARDLIAAGHDVHLLLRPGHKTWRLSGLAGAYTPQIADLRDAAAVQRAVYAARPHVVYHLATHGAYPTQKDRAEIVAANVEGTSHLLRAAAAVDYRMFVHAGSSSEYGHRLDAMCEDDPLDPQGAYAEGKVAASLLCLDEAKKGRPVTVVRIFSAYGPWEEPSRLVPYVMGCCLRDEPPRVTSGSQPRDFIAVDDVVSLLRLVGSEPEFAGRVLHAGTGVQSRVRDMIEAIIAVSGRKLKAQYGQVNMRPGEPERWVASIERTKAITGWEPKLDLAAGVKRMWNWYRHWADRPPVLGRPSLLTPRMAESLSRAG